ncbi:MAG: class I SAM-dependent methyltransferase [Desulfuromusa sp.]|jgi:ubiquinone/menaquinone biosynthesis C-methylase UbiE|nr:class I SAM-dependent methyltransferase [Desulfuromusa sp.]
MKWIENDDLGAFTHRSSKACIFGALHAEQVFRSLELDKGSCLLDAGCGPGEYSVLAAKQVGETGSVIALDRDSWMIEQLNKAIAAHAITNIFSQIADLGEPLPLRDRLADAVLISAVLHMPGLNDRWHILFPELQRILRRNGRLGIIERNNAAAPIDHPLHLRLSPETIANEILRYGFKQCGLIELTPSRFLMLFEKQDP